MFTAPSQILCTVFGVHIYYYGVILAIAIVIGTLFSDFFGEKFFKLKKETILDLSPYLVIFGIIGARLYYCILNYEFYLRFPTEILALRHGGISIHGAILGGVLGLIIYSVRHKISFARLCDVSSVGLVLAQAVGRWGNFFNSEAFGSPTNLPWKLYIAPQYRPIPYTENKFFHPTFLYESILDFIIFAILILFVKYRKTTSDGDVAILYLILYSCVRILVESLRIDSVRYIHGYPIATIVSVFIIVLSIAILVIKNMSKRKC